MAKANHIFGIHAVTTCLETSPHNVKQLWVQQGRQDKKIQLILDLAKKAGLPVQSLSAKSLDKMCDGRHQGVLAEVKQSSNKYSESDLPSIIGNAEQAFVLILDGVEDPHNLGACLRSADAAGVNVVIAPKDKAVGITPTVSKVACGAAETVPFIQVTNLARTMQWLQQQGIWIYGAAGEATESIFNADLKGQVAIAMGAEGKGLRRLTREHCDYLIKIPMLGNVESLNVSVATGICLFQVLQQRLKN